VEVVAEMNLEQVTAFAAAAAVLTVIPGTDTLLVMRNTLRGGIAAGWKTTIGICPGLFVHATVSALGMSAILRHFPRGFEVLQVAGALYLGYLGLRSLRAAWSPVVAAPDLAVREGSATRGTAGLLAEGFLCNVLNPKTMVFYIAFLPQFLRSGDPVWTSSLLLAGVHWVEGMLWLGFLVHALSRVRRWLLHPTTLRLLELASGVLLVGFALRLAIARL